MGKVVLQLWLPSFALCCWAKHHDPKQPGVERVSFTKLVWTWFSGKMTPELNSYKSCSLRNYLEIDRVRILKRSDFSKEKWVARIDLRHWEKTKQEAKWKMKSWFPVHMCYEGSERERWLYSYADMDGNAEIVLTNKYPLWERRWGNRGVTAESEIWSQPSKRLIFLFPLRSNFSQTMKRKHASCRMLA